MRIARTLLIGGLFFCFAGNALASEGETVAQGPDVTTFLWIAVILLAAKLASLVSKIGQPTVLGELIIGVILGNLVYIGVIVFEPIKQDSIIHFLAELGVVILLFQIGLESNISKMRKVGIRVFLVAVIGVIVPFVLGVYIIGPWLLPGLDQISYLFLGAALTATSTGITARVFQDLGKLHISAAQIVLGAAVVDDVIGLIILAVVSVLAVAGAITLGIVSGIVAKAVFFLVGAIILGQIAAPKLGKLLAKISPTIGMKFSLALSFGLIFAYVGQEYFGLAAIVGAFAAGLVLDPVHFKYFQQPEMLRDVKEAVKDVNGNVKKRINSIIAHYSHRHVEDLIEPIVYFLVPIFFVVTGMSVDLATLFNPQILLVALGITALAFVGKLVSGFAAAKGDRLLVGFGMIPRGEVGLIFATIGKGLGVVSDEVFSVIVIMVIFTTLLTPPILTFLLKRQNASESIVFSHLGLGKFHLSPSFLLRLSRNPLHLLHKRRKK
jgi:Kef-type K+ transport system membrane component KefB